MFMKKFTTSRLLGLSLILVFTFSASAQALRKTTKKKATKKTVSAKTQTAITETETPPAIKKNSRPETEIQITPTVKADDTVKSNVRPAAVQPKPVYFYEFSKADFLISKLNIEHDATGKGKITFQKRNFAEPITDPLQLSAVTLERVKAIWQALNFLDSTENYQDARDYSHLGTMNFSMKRDGRERSATFNWTDNKDAKNLADEYRRIGQQFVWIFDINVARENQPLESPALIDALDALVRRKEISDPVQMIPLLKELSADERIPLIARNRATKLIERIEKSANKN